MILTGLNVGVNLYVCAKLFVINEHIVFICYIPLSTKEVNTGYIYAVNLHNITGNDVNVLGLYRRLNRIFTGIYGRINRISRSLGSSYSNVNSTALKCDGYSIACVSNCEECVTIGIATVLIAVGNIPRVLLNNLELIRAGRNVFINLNKIAGCLVVNKVVGSIAYVPCSAEDGSIVVRVRSGNGILTCTTRAHAVGVIGVAGRCDRHLISLTALGACMRSFTILSTCSGNNYSSLTCRSVSASLGSDKRPCSATIIPGTGFNGIVIVGAIILKVSSLIPLIVPVISGSRRIHSAEDNILNSCGNGTFVNAILISIGHIEPFITTIPGVKGEASVIYLPVRVGSKVNNGICSCLCRRCGNCCKAHQKCENYKKSEQDFACVFHNKFLSYFCCKNYSTLLKVMQ